MHCSCDCLWLGVIFEQAHLELDANLQAPEDCAPPFFHIPAFSFKKKSMFFISDDITNKSF